VRFFVSFADDDFQADPDLLDLRDCRIWDLGARAGATHDLKRVLSPATATRPISLCPSMRPKTGESEANISPNETNCFATLVVSH
jgi:hypothetical protein